MSVRRPSWLDRFSTRELVWEGSRLLLLASMVAVILPPILYAISLSIRPQTEFTNPLYLFPPPGEITFAWYGLALDAMGADLMVSYLRGLGSSVIGLAVAIPGAYAVARRSFPFRRLSFYWVVGVQVFPVVVLVVPLMVIFFASGINDTVLGLWFADQVFVVPFAVWILRDYFNSMPGNLEESARIYGCTEFGAFLRVILPLTLPALLAVGFLGFVHGWNEFIFAQLLTGETASPAIIHLQILSHPGTRKHWGRGMAKTLILSAPPAALYLFARRSMQEAFAFD